MAELALVVDRVEREAEARRPEVGLERERWVEGLSDAELVGRVMAGPSGALSRASRLLEEIGGLSRMLHFEAALSEVPVSTMERERLELAFELARRLAWAAVPEAEPLSEPGALARFLLLRFGRLDQEVGGAIYLDHKNRLLSVREVFAGAPSRASVSPVPLLRMALQLGSPSLAFFHTHTSSDPTPSLEDLTFTRKLKEGAEMLGLQLVDHVIVAQGGKWLSLQQVGKL